MVLPSTQPTLTPSPTLTVPSEKSSHPCSSTTPSNMNGSTVLASQDTDSNSDTLTKIPFATRSGRHTTVFDLQKMDLVNFLIHPQEDLSHTPKPFTPGWRIKFLKKNATAKFMSNLWFTLIFAIHRLRLVYLMRLLPRSNLTY